METPIRTTSIMWMMKTFYDHWMESDMPYPERAIWGQYHYGMLLSFDLTEETFNDLCSDVM